MTIDNQTTEIYTTEDLIRVLKDEQAACAKGERTIPLPDDADAVVGELAGDLGKILGADRMYGMHVYHEFRDRVHEYQRQHSISGLVIDSIPTGGADFRFPIQHSQLTLIPEDYEVLKAAKDRVIAKFLEFAGMGFAYLYHSIAMKNSEDFQVQTTLEDLTQLLSEPCWEWAELRWSDEELALNVGWGEPIGSMYIHDKNSDSLWIGASWSCRIVV